MVCASTTRGFAHSLYSCRVCGRSQPISVEASEGDDELEKKQFSWWNYDRDVDTGAQTYANVEDAIEYVAAVCREQGPFDGVLGFSQGGMLASFVLERQRTSLAVVRAFATTTSACTQVNERTNNVDGDGGGGVNTDQSPERWPFAFAFGIFASAPQAVDPRFVTADLQLDIPSLHIIGETDTIVAPERCKQLAEDYVDPTVLLHPGGHYIPTNKDAKDALRDLFKRIQAAKQEQQQ